MLNINNNNFTVICVKTNPSGILTEGKVYNIIDGYLTYDDSDRTIYAYNSVEELNARFSNTTFKLYTQPTQVEIGVNATYKNNKYELKWEYGDDYKTSYSEIRLYKDSSTYTIIVIYIKNKYNTIQEANNIIKTFGFELVEPKPKQITITADNGSKIVVDIETARKYGFEITPTTNH